MKQKQGSIYTKLKLILFSNLFLPIKVCCKCTHKRQLSPPQKPVLWLVTFPFPDSVPSIHSCLPPTESLAVPSLICPCPSKYLFYVNSPVFSQLKPVAISSGWVRAGAANTKSDKNASNQKCGQGLNWDSILVVRGSGLLPTFHLDQELTTSDIYEVGVTSSANDKVKEGMFSPIRGI